MNLFTEENLPRLMELLQLPLRPLDELCLRFPEIRQLDFMRLSMVALETFAERNKMSDQEAMQLYAYAISAVLPKVREVHFEQLEFRAVQALQKLGQIPRDDD